MCLCRLFCIRCSKFELLYCKYIKNIEEPTDRIIFSVQSRRFHYAIQSIRQVSGGMAETALTPQSPKR